MCEWSIRANGEWKNPEWRHPCTRRLLNQLTPHTVACLSAANGKRPGEHSTPHDAIVQQAEQAATKRGFAFSVTQSLSATKTE